MGGCSTHAIQAVPPDAVTSRVEDMICGHCVGAFKKTIATGLPGAEVEASPAFQSRMGQRHHRFEFHQGHRDQRWLYADCSLRKPSC